MTDCVIERKHRPPDRQGTSRASEYELQCAVVATFVWPSEAQQLPPEVVFHALTGPAPESRLVVGWRAAPKPSPALAAFLGIAAEM